MRWWSVQGSRGCMRCTGCAGWGSTSRASKPVTASAAPGSGTAIPAAGATCRRSSTRTAGTRSSSRSGASRRRCRPSPRSSGTSTTSPTATTFASTSGSSTRVTSATYDDARGRWVVDTDRGERFDVRWLVMATGSLSAPNFPDIPGIDTFAGRLEHTGLWPRDGVDVTGLRVGIIGTGSSGMQSIPHLARDAAHLTVFQRTPNYAFAAPGHPDRSRVRVLRQGALPRGPRAPARFPSRHLGVRPPARKATTTPEPSGRARSAPAATSCSTSATR